MFKFVLSLIKVHQIMRSIYLTIFLSFLFLISLRGQSIITDRPDQTESSVAVGKNRFQIETGILAEFTGEEGESFLDLFLPTTLFRIGVLDGLELRVVQEVQLARDQTKDLGIGGIGDLQLGFKVELFNKESSGTEIGFMSHVIMPTGSEKLSTDQWGMVNKLLISHELSDRWSVGYNLGYDFFEIDKGDLTYSLALGYGLSDKIGLYVEPYGAIVNFDDLVANFDAGFTYLANDRLQYDFSFGSGINQKMNYVAVGLSLLY